MKYESGNFFSLPNEIFLLGLNAGELAVYSWPSVKTIGKAVNMSGNTVRKYICQLEERGLITTEPTTVITKSSGWRNGNLLFTVSPIGEVIDEYYDQQMAVLEQTAARQRARRKAEKSGVEFVPPGKEQSA